MTKTLTAQSSKGSGLSPKAVGADVLKGFSVANLEPAEQPATFTIGFPGGFTFTPSGDGPQKASASSGIPVPPAAPYYPSFNPYSTDASAFAAGGVGVGVGVPAAYGYAPPAPPHHAFANYSVGTGDYSNAMHHAGSAGIHTRDAILGKKKKTEKNCWCC
ncbi:unnamed protein product [Amoebophrya sp. A120]|nr:unnamed protein product [Amoebophrya sp. A120]|eukprot:GSA120T00010835001.1